MKKAVIALLSLLLISKTTDAQFTRYLVKLKHKGGTPFSLATPSAYLSQRAIDRRTKYSITIDSTDLPANPSFITQIDNIPNVTILNVSKWLNQLSIETTDANAITAINALSFVQSTSAIAARMSSGITAPVKNKFDAEEQSIQPLPQQRLTQLTADYFNYGTNSFNEINLHKGQFLHNIGLRGQGMQIAMLDGGYNNYLTLDAMDSIVINNQVLGTWDFVNRETSVNEDHPHGMWCLSTMCANIPGVFMGKSPKASFYLYKTEDTNNEYPIEEHNMVCGMERADSVGADVISASLGYYDFDNSVFNHSYSEFNGNTTMCAIGADLAAKKGILFFIAAGNEGTNAWHYIITPADADSVMAVGAVDISGAVGSFSSFGPSSDGQIKPDVASIGVAAMIQATNNTVSTLPGTSLATPNMAGLGTCLWQGFPEYNNMRVIAALRSAGSISASPNDRIGYGIPNMKKAFGSLLRDFATSTATVNSCTATLNWTTKDISAMAYEIERKTPADAAFVKIADVAAATGNVLLGNRSYTFINTLVNVSAGTVQYRIRQKIDTSAAEFAAEYIDTASFTLATGCTTTATGNTTANGEKISVLPNPSSSITNLLIETPYAIQQMTIAIHDSKGRLVNRKITSKVIGKTFVELPYQKLSPGKYYVTVYNGKKIILTAEWIKL